MAKQEKEVERWITVNGARVPIFKDGSIGGPKELRDKLKASKDKKSADKTKKLPPYAQIEKSRPKNMSKEQLEKYAKSRGYSIKDHTTKELREMADKEWLDEQMGLTPSAKSTKNMPSAKKAANKDKKKEATKQTKAKTTMSPREKVNSMTEAQLRAMVKKAGLTKQYNMMMNTRPGAYGYSKQLQVLRDLIADYLAVKENKKR